ncbi:protein kinase domain-containing protein [Nonomuraea indica]|uniref:Serine/threonine protein kinase n=1 Tax=Nonomuraea indica TaxID=1581193 RepID=A0ABW8A335_9ACTN
MNSLNPRDPEQLGAYTILERVGEGPRGVVYLGRRGEDGTPYAIKVLPAMPDAADVAQRLKGGERISSSYVARVIDTGVWEGRPYVVREHIEGRSLADVVRDEGPLSGDALERVAVGVLTALTPIHLAGLTHGGLTPQNVIMSADGPRVTDAAIGPPVGEVGYRSPEQLNGEPFDAYTDVFSWASVVTFAATGNPPFGQDAQAVMNVEPDLGELAEPLRGVVLSCLAKLVAERPTTYTALLRLLGDNHAGLPGVVPPVPMQPMVPPQAPAGDTVLLPPGQDAPPLQGLPVPPPPVVAHQQAPPPPTWGPPPADGQDLPRQTWADSPVQSAAAPRRAFPVGLVGALGAVVLVSGLGLWGATSYAPKQTLQSAAAPGATATVSSAGAAEGSDGGQPVVPGDGTQQQPPASGEPQVTVPWAQTPDPTSTGVLPFELPRDEPTEMAVPELSTVPSPLPTQPVIQQQYPTQPVTQPTGQPTVAQPTVTATATATVTPTATPTPSSSPTPDDQISGEPVPTRSHGKPTRDPEPTSDPTEQPRPSDPPRPSELPTRSEQPEPTVTPSSRPTTEQPKPTVTPTTRPTTSSPKPSVTVTVRPTVRPTTTSPKPTVRPTTTSPKPTVRPTTTSPKPTVRPTTTSPKPTVRPTTTSPKPTVKPTTAAPKPTQTRNPHTPTSVCGSGFYVQRQGSFAGGVTYQLYNNSTGENCVVTIKTADIGKATPVTATLEIQGGGRQTDSGNFEYYAGPVKMQGKGKCVRFEGGAGSGRTSADWGNCG